MRWYVARVGLLTLFGAICGCSSAGHGPFIAPPEDDGTAGANAIGGGAGSAHAGDAGAATTQGGGASGGDAGATPDDGAAGAPESDAGASPASSGSAGKGSGGQGGAAAVPTLPSAPSDLVLKVASSTSVQLSWTDTADNENGYEVYWSDSDSKPNKPNKQLSADVTTFTAAGLTEGQEYNFWVQAYNDLGSSLDITGKATPRPVPAAPTGLTIAAGPSDTVLAWTDTATTETGYRIYLATSNTQPKAAQFELPEGATTYTVPGSVIDPYTKYYYWVVAYNSAGDSVPATGSGMTGVAPVAPSAVLVDASGVWSVAVSWFDNSDYSSSFNIYWSTDDTKPASPNATAPGSSNTYKMTSVLGNKTYRFWVESVNPLATSTASKGTASKGSYDLAWTDLYYDPNANTIHQAIQDTFGLLGDSDPTTGLYAYHTTAQTLGSASALNPAINWNPAGASIDVTQTQSFWSEARTPNGSAFSVRTLTPPGALSTLNATPNQLSVALSWSAATLAGGYQIYKGTNATFANATSYAVQSGTAVTVTGLNPGTAYTFWVRPLGVAINGTGLPGATVTQAATTTGPAVGNNLALNKTAVASSDKTDSPKVVDGSVTSHWQAATTATSEWIYVNLGDGNDANITHVKLVWESSYATSFDIQVCAASCDDDSTVTVDNWAWTTAYSGSVAPLSGFPNYQFVTLTTPTFGQFIRLKPKTLSGSTGPSLDEFQIFSASP